MSDAAGLLRAGIPDARSGETGLGGRGRGGDRDGYRDGLHGADARPSPGLDRARSASIGLWVFIGVASSLFWLFLLAFALRMNGSDWFTIALPWQLWLSTALLIAGSLAMQRASRTAAQAARTLRLQWLVAGALALAFLAVQLWAWQALSARQVVLAGNPAASFFYLLTAMHGLHVVGGLAAWLLVDRQLRRDAVDPARGAWRIALCARYWHFLLAVWIALFAAIGWLSPDFVRYLCGTA